MFTKLRPLRECARQKDTIMFQVRHYAMLDKLPTINPEPMELDDDPIKRDKTSKAMRAYVQNAKKYNEFMAKQREEFQIGKRHLANMMGANPETFTQDDINNAIEYLFPCGLFDVKARPIMKPPEEVFPPKKEAQFDESGRPFHFLFYTGKPYFYEMLHDAVHHLKELNEYEDKINSGVLKKETEEVYVDYGSSEWIPKKDLEKRVFEPLSDNEYNNYVTVMTRLIEHPYSHKVSNFILKCRKPLPPTLSQIAELIIMHTDDGRKYVTAPEITRKSSKAVVTVYTPGTGKISINGKDIFYFDDFKCREAVLFPLIFTDMLNKIDIEATTHTGGPSGQAGAVRFGISLCLKSFVDDDMVEKMRIAGLLKLDPRRKERKKPGQWGARRKFTWKKR